MPKVVPPPFAPEADPVRPIPGRGLGPQARAVIGEAGGMTPFGVHRERLPPGLHASHRHAAEDAIVHVPAGEVAPVEDGGTVRRAGAAACRPAGQGPGQCLRNRSGADALSLVVGTRAAADRATRPDHELVCHRQGAARWHSHADGTPVNPVAGGTP